MSLSIYLETFFKKRFIYTSSVSIFLSFVWQFEQKLESNWETYRILNWQELYTAGEVRGKSGKASNKVWEKWKENYLQGKNI